MLSTPQLLKESTPLKRSADLDPLIEKTKNAEYVLLGEASHGTHEYYTWRTAITKRLVVENGFSFIAVEGDWPDCYGINRYVKGFNDHGNTAVEVLKQFKRWPTWMWANWEVAALMEWLREHNKTLPPGKKIGFYGLDVYSLWESMDVIVNYLRKEDPRAAKLAIDAVRCFEPYEEGHDYAKALLNLSAHCADEVVRLLGAVKSRSRHYDHDPEAALNAEMNSQVIAKAEEYYRSMISFRDQSWNIRDSHMAETLDTLMKFHGRKSRAIVWEHNTHVGDARFTDMRDDGMCNVGQLVREKHHRKDEVFIVGFSSFEGSIMAGRSWGAPMEKMTVPEAAKDSIEALLHIDSPDNKLILLDNTYWKERLSEPIGHRAIGVVYHPENERGNYVPSLIPFRYDALIHVDKTTALHALHFDSDSSKVPDTYPFGL